MDNYLLPATRYEPPPRQVRKHILNTIIEDERSDDEEVGSSFKHVEDDSRGRKRNFVHSRQTGSRSPVPSLTSSASSYFEDNRKSRDFDELYDVSDDDSLEDHDITPGRTTYTLCSLPSSPQNSYGPQRTRNQYPSIVIPSPSHWPTIQKLQKNLATISPARPPKIPLSPAVLSLLSHGLPSLSQPPSLDGSLNSDPHATSTAPTTPDMQINPDSEGEWGKMEIKEKSLGEGRLSIFDGAQDPGAKIGIFDGDEWENIDGYDFDGISIRDFGSDPGHSLPDSPVLGLDDSDSDAGIQLPPEALITLRNLSLTISSKSDFASDTESIKEMEEVPFGSVQPRSVDMTPISHTSEYSLDQLSIPSPGGFFSSLALNARHTWCFNKSRPPSLMPPTSAIAEQFYNRPWSMDHQSSVEQIVEVDDDDSNGPPTARQMPFPPRADDHPEQDVTELPQSPVAESVSTSNEYQKEYQPTDGNHFDRTTVWLAAQSSYMAALRETNPVNEVGIDSMVSKRPSLHARNDSLDSPMKKAVRFLESEMIQHERAGDNKPHQGDSIYYHAFQHLSNDRDSRDAFRHQQTRSDSIQAGRICLPHEHLDRLQGKYAINNIDRPNPLRPVSMFPGKDVDGNEQTMEQKVISRVERERQALEQLNTSMWIMEASRFLNAGKLLNSPGVKNPSSQPNKNEGPTESMHVLDLGGLPNCDWAWHCSREYPQAKVYTATPETQTIDPNIRGPRNHRCQPVSKLWELPYQNDHFDAISARSLFAHLKTDRPPNQSLDEYDLCLRECLRCLKPGGYIEFFLLDSEIIHAGARATAVSVEFGFNLKTRGYDPCPTKNWLGRLRRAGFDDIKRAWTFLPIGAPAHKDPLPVPETPPPPSHLDRDVGYGSANANANANGNVNFPEAVRGPLGSTRDVANVAGLVGGWAWEQWMLKLQLEMGKEVLLEGVGNVLEEGKFTGAGWRCLSGWARKPVG